MAITNCSECNGKLATDADECPHCGHKNSSAQGRAILQKARNKRIEVQADIRRGGMGWVAFGLIGAVAVFLIGAIGYSEYNRARLKKSLEEAQQRSHHNAEVEGTYQRRISELEGRLRGSEERRQTAEEESLRHERQARASERDAATAVQVSRERDGRIRQLQDQIRALESGKTSDVDRAMAQLRAERDALEQRIKDVEAQKVDLEVGRIIVHLKTGPKLTAMSCLDAEGQYKITLVSGGVQTVKKDDVDRMEVVRIKTEERPPDRKKPEEKPEAPGRSHITMATWENAVAYVNSDQYTTAQKQKKWGEIAGKYMKLKAVVTDVVAYGKEHRVSWQSVDDVVTDYYDNKAQRRKLQDSSSIDKKAGDSLRKGDVITVILRVSNYLGRFDSDTEIDK